LIDEIESEYHDNLLRFPGVKANYFKEVGFNDKNKFKSRTSFKELLRDNLNESSQDIR
jgi:hypothetical protein